jgi:hypothetical protein
MHASAEPSLAGLQARMAAALLAADARGQELPAALFTGATPGTSGMRVHRNTVLSAISDALRHSFVSIDRLVGVDFFDRMAIEFARAAPPRAPQLDEYGGEFPDFISGFPGTENLPYLAELARFDWQLDVLGRVRADEHFAGATLLLEGGVRLRFCSSLRVHRSTYAVESLRVAVLAEDLPALRAMNFDPTEHAYALWRAQAGVKVHSLGAASARLLSAVLAGADAATALAAAAAGADAAAVAQLLVREILPAGFVRIEKETT